MNVLLLQLFNENPRFFLKEKNFQSKLIKFCIKRYTFLNTLYQYDQFEPTKSLNFFFKLNEIQSTISHDSRSISDILFLVFVVLFH